MEGSRLADCPCRGRRLLRGKGLPPLKALRCPNSRSKAAAEDASSEVISLTWSKSPARQRTSETVEANACPLCFQKCRRFWFAQTRLKRPSLRKRGPCAGVQRSEWREAPACRRADLSDDDDAATVSSRFHPLADDSIRFAAVIARRPGRVDVRGVDGVAARREELVGTAKEAALSAVQPNTLPPRTIGAVKRSVRPKLRRYPFSRRESAAGFPSQTFVRYPVTAKQDSANATPIRSTGPRTPPDVGTPAGVSLTVANRMGY